MRPSPSFAHKCPPAQIFGAGWGGCTNNIERPRSSGCPGPLATSGDGIALGREYVVRRPLQLLGSRVEEAVDQGRIAGQLLDGPLNDGPGARSAHALGLLDRRP